MKNKLERRYLAQEFRVSDNGAPIIEGYAAKFGVRSEDMGGWMEVIAPDAFDASLASNPDVRALFNHDANLVLGRTASGTLQLKKDATGLFYTINPPDTQVARDLITSMRRGDVNQSSFAFIAEDTSWGYDEVTGIDIRTIKQASLWDVSPVTYPAYSAATSGVRSMPSDMPAEVRSKVAKRDDTQCSCPCPECLDGDCEDCSHDPCGCDGCDCPQNRTARPANVTAPVAVSEDELRRMQMRLRMIQRP
jgi:hypothetical protein